MSSRKSDLPRHRCSNAWCWRVGMGKRAAVDFTTIRIPPIRNPWRCEGMSMPYENLLYEKRDGIAYITFNRPKVLNALNRKTIEELQHILLDARDEASVRVLILTGSGEKAFVAGADINELAQQTPVNGKEFSLFGQGVFHLLETMGKPSICAINGFALGGGCELALSCTFESRGRPRRLGQPEVKLGIIPGYGGSQRLARLCGKGVAHELCLTG